MLKKPKKRTLLISVGVIAVIIAAGGIALWTYHGNPQFCGICHIMDPYVESWESPPLLANAHAEYDLTCLDCHPFSLGQSVSEVVSFVRGDYEQPLQQRSQPKEWCLACHEHGSYAELVERTEDYEIDGEKHNPHHPHAENEEYECHRCHDMHKEQSLTSYCYSCHHEGGLVTCDDCHEREGVTLGP